jgi:hypothetical protein
MKKSTLFPGLAAMMAGTLNAAPLVATGIYDEQSAQTNAVDFSMGYSGNTTWTTGIGQTLGAAQIMDLATFKPLVEAAFTTGNGGVISFDGVNNADYNNMQSFDISFASETKGMTLGNRIDGSYSLAGPMGDRTAISGDQFLSTGGNPHFDLDFRDFTGFEPNEKITAVGVTILGRSNQGTGRNFRVSARYTNGVDSGSSSTFRSFDMQNGNTTQDSFSGIVAPDGYWITSMRVHSDGGIFTGIDDIGFITSIVDNPDNPPLIVTDLPASIDAPFNSTVNLAVTLDPATSPPPTWQWEFDAAPEDGVFVPVPAEDGGTNATLSFTSGPAREGTYRVTATNSQGSATSEECVLRVALSQPFIISDLPSTLTAVEREVVVLSVTIDPATYPEATYQWFFNDVEIPTSEGGTNPTLTVIAGPDTDGLYYVDVENSEGLALSAGLMIEHLADADGDGIPDIYETGTGVYLSPTDTGTDPNNPDSDDDGLLDGGDITVPSDDPRYSAWAAAGISFIDNGGTRTFLGEAGFGTDPNLPDTDGDGLLDGDNITLTSADPRHAEWTALGIVFADDGAERTFFGELAFGTDPLLADTDGDGVPDGQEVIDGTNPNWFNDALEWRPDGQPGGPGLWSAVTTNWFDGETPPGTATVWDSTKIGLFPHPAGAVTVAGTQQANRLIFRHTGGTYNVNAAAPGDTLAFTGADPLVRVNRETRFNLPVSGGFMLEADGTQLRLTTDNSATLAGETIRVASGQLRGQNGDIGIGNELGGPDSTIIIENGAQIRYFNANQGARNYTPTLRLAGPGTPGGNPGALNNDSNAANNIQWTGDIILDADARIATQNAATWTFGNIHDDGAADKTLHLTQQANTTNITGTVTLGNLLKDGGGALNLTSGAKMETGTLTLGGGTVRLNAPSQLAADIEVAFSNAAATLDLNGHDQAVERITGPGAITGTGTLDVTGEINPGGAGFQLNVTGNLTLNGASWLAIVSSTTANRLNVQGTLDLTNTVLDITASGLTEETYILANYGAVEGIPTVENLPDGYQLDISHNSGTQVALVRTPTEDDFDAWAAANGIAGEPFDGDFDGDGIPNGLEWILGGNPADGQSGGLVTTIATASGGLTLQFTRNTDTIGQATLTVEYNATLGNPWNSVIIGTTSSGPDANGVTITIDPTSAKDDITVTIPASNAVGGRLFGRLRASQ